MLPHAAGVESGNQHGTCCSRAESKPDWPEEPRLTRRCVNRQTVRDGRPYLLPIVFIAGRHIRGRQVGQVGAQGFVGAGTIGASVEMTPGLCAIVVIEFD